MRIVGKERENGPTFLLQCEIETLQADPPVGIMHLLTNKGQMAVAIEGQGARDVAAKLLVFAGTSLK